MFLSTDQLDRIQSWKYKVIDNSISTEIFGQYYNIAGSYIPKFIAPNVITLTGLFTNLVILTVAGIYGNNISLFFYLFAYYFVVFLDIMDGIHARNTKNDSPLGEFLDHSVDVVSMFTIIKVTAIILNAPDTFNLAMICITIGIFFCEVHYQALINGGVVVLDRYISPLESLTIIAILYFFHYLTGLGHIIFNDVVIFLCYMIYFYKLICIMNKFKKECINILCFQIILIVSYFTGCHLSQIFSIIMICNGELILNKMGHFDIREISIVSATLCLIDWRISFVISFFFITIPIYQMIKHMDLKLFRTISR